MVKTTTIIMSLICWTLSAATVIMPRHAHAQTNETRKVIVDAADLTAEQLAKIEAKSRVDQVKDNLQNAVQYAHWGKEIGVAVNDTLSSLTTHTEQFAKTDVGRLAMFLVAWKIMYADILNTGKTAVHIVIGIPLLVFLLAIIFWSYRRLCIPRRVIQSIEGPWYGRTKITYMVIDPLDKKKEPFSWPLVHTLMAFISIIVCCIIIFT